MLRDLKLPYRKETNFLQSDIFKLYWPQSIPLLLCGKSIKILKNIICNGLTWEIMNELIAKFALSFKLIILLKNRSPKLGDTVSV